MNNTKSTLFENPPLETESLPLVLLHAPNYGNAFQLLQGLKQQACSVEELAKDADIPAILLEKRPSLLVLGSWSTETPADIAKVHKIQEVCRSISCTLFLLYYAYDKGALERVASLMPDDFCPFEPLELILLRLKMALNSAREAKALTKLKESEERFRVMADSAALMMWTMTRKQEWYFLNKTWLKLIGLDEEHASQWIDRVHPFDHTNIKQVLDDVLKNPRPFRWEGEILYSDQNTHLIALSGVPRYEAGEFAGFVGSILDITEKKTFEHAVARRQRALAAQGLIQRKLLTNVGGQADMEVLNILADITEVGSASLWKLDEVKHLSGQVTWSEVSTAHREARSFQLNREGSHLWSRLRVGKTFSLNLSDLKGAERDFFSQRLSTFILLAPIISRGHLCGVLVLESKEADFQWDVMNLDLVQVAVAGFAVAQTQAEAEKERSRLAAFPRLSPNPFLILTPDYCQFENLAARNLLQKFKLEKAEKLLPDNYPALVTHCLQTGRAHQVMSTIGQDVRFNWTFVPVKDESIVLAYGADISHLVALEKRLLQSQRMEALGELTSSIGHEFNNLLSAIQGAVDLIAFQPGLPTVVMDQVSEISWEAERGAALARQLFLYSKEGSIKRRLMDLTEVVSNMGDILDRVVGSGMTRTLDLQCGLPPILGDCDLIEQAIYNLVLNAREASKGTGVVTISTCLVEPEAVSVQMSNASPQGYLRLSISDCGEGMEVDESDRIFEPLYTTKNSKEHSGLGLFVVYSVVIEHEGWIEVSSVPGVGTTFQLYFPTVPKGITEKPTWSDGDEEVVGTILLVEDNVAVAKNTCKLLTHHGHVVHLAHSGDEALNLWKNHHEEIDVVLCDVVLDAIFNGPDLAKKFKSQKPSVKIVLTSGYSREFAMQTFGVPSDSLFISKPFTIFELTEIIQEAMPVHAF